MSRYIDADKLIAEIERRKVEWRALFDGKENTAAKECFYEDENILSFIDSLQQEQPELVKGKFVFPKYLYARTKDNKTIDMSYAQQDMTAIEYIRKDALLEWLNECKDNPVVTELQRGNIRELIEKIESL